MQLQTPDVLMGKVGAAWRAGLMAAPLRALACPARPVHLLVVRVLSLL